MRRLSPTRVTVGLALAAWAGVFWFLLVTDRWTLYLSSRIFWVVPVGAVLLTATALGRLLTARTERAEPLAVRDTWGLALVLVPVVAVLALPPTALGSYAASRRSVSAGFVTAAGEPSSGEVTLVDVAGAMWSQTAADSLTERAGSEVSFVGFVVRREGTPADEFVLTRFLVSCCVADALSVQVRVVGAPPGAFEEDEWVRVQGTLYPLPDQVVVDAASVKAVPRPAQPYLNV
ncbi:MAG TPA: TIGR03943 family protein [Actinomycetota bacterium]